MFTFALHRRALVGMFKTLLVQLLYQTPFVKCEIGANGFIKGAICKSYVSLMVS